jgi:AcrR family transcriptional regulator
LNSSVHGTGVDQRREAGARTRGRLLDAALELLAERGEGNLKLREVTGAANANVAAVSYHFGSLRSLCDAAVEQALGRYLDAQQESVGALAPGATLAELAAAFAAPMLSALAVGGRELSLMRIVARAGIDPPRGWGRFDASFQQIRGDVLRVLKANLPGVTAAELDFRTRCAAGLLNWLVLAPVGADLRHKSFGQLEQLVLPVLAGIFVGESAGRPAAATRP